MRIIFLEQARRGGMLRMVFDYFYGAEREYFRYYQMPAVMLEDDSYRKISANAKLLYAVLLNLVSLSRANDWLESGTNRVYIICPQKEIAYRLGCSLRSAAGAVKELEEFGLLERRKQGQGRPELLFVKNFASGASEPGVKGFDGQEAYRREGGYEFDEYGEENCVETFSGMQKLHVRNFSQDGTCQEIADADRPESPRQKTGHGINGYEDKAGKQEPGLDRDSAPFSDKQELHVKTGRKRMSRQAESACQDKQKVHVKTGRKCMSRQAESACQDKQFLHANYIYNNKLDGTISNQSINLAANAGEGACPGEYGAGGSLPVTYKGRQGQGMKSCRESVRRQIDYDTLLHDQPLDKELIDGLVELLAELYAGNRETIRISGEEMEAGAVRERLRKVDLNCMRYVLSCLRGNTGKVHNIRQYLIAAMYNAPATIRHFYQAEANYRLYAGDG